LSASLETNQSFPFQHEIIRLPHLVSMASGLVHMA